MTDIKKVRIEGKVLKSSKEKMKAYASKYNNNTGLAVEEAIEFFIKKKGL